MNQELLVRVNDNQFFTPEYCVEVQNALMKSPKAENIHFLINAWGGNIKTDVPPRDRWLRYNSQVTVHLGDMRKLIDDPVLLAATVLTRLFSIYKTHLVIH